MIYMFLADGFEETEALCPLDILRRAGADIATVSINKTALVTGSHKIRVTADMTLSQIDPKIKPEMVILPGGVPGTPNLNADGKVLEIVSGAARDGAYVAAICAAPMILGGLGLLDGKSAVCYPGYEKYLKGASVTSDSKVVRDGNIITAKGMGVSLSFGLVLAEVLYGADKASAIAEAIQC